MLEVEINMTEMSVCRTKYLSRWVTLWPEFIFHRGEFSLHSSGAAKIKRYQWNNEVELIVSAIQRSEEKAEKTSSCEVPANVPESISRIKERELIQPWIEYGQKIWLVSQCTPLIGIN